MDNPSPERRTLHFFGYLGLHLEKDPSDGEGVLFHRNGTLCVGQLAVPFILERPISGRPEKLYTNGKDIPVTIMRLMPVRDERQGYSTFKFVTDDCEFRASIPDTHLREFFGELGWTMVKGSNS